MQNERERTSWGRGKQLNAQAGALMSGTRGEAPQKTEEREIGWHSYSSQIGGNNQTHRAKSKESYKEYVLLWHLNKIKHPAFLDDEYWEKKGQKQDDEGVCNYISI